MDVPRHVGERRPRPARLRITLRGVMLFIVLVALATTVVIQTVRLREAEAREQRLRAESDAVRVFMLEAVRTAEVAEDRARVLEADGVLSGVN